MNEEAQEESPRADPENFASTESGASGTCCADTRPHGKSGRARLTGVPMRWDSPDSGMFGRDDHSIRQSTM